MKLFPLYYLQLQYIFNGMQNLTIIGDEAITQASVASSGFPEMITEVYISGTIPSVGDSAFLPCPSIKKVVILSPVTILGVSSFQNLRTLTEIDLGKAMITLDTKCLSGTSIKILNFPVTLQMVKNNALSGLESITQINVPVNGNFRSIEPEGFFNSKMTSLYLPEGFTTLSGSALRGTSLTSLHIPSTLINIGSNAFSYCNALTQITISSLNTQYFIQNNVLYLGTTLHECPGGIPSTADGHMIIPDFVKSIGFGAFEGNTRIVTVTFGVNVTYISNAAFKRASALRAVENYDKVTYIGTQAFDATSIRSFTIPLSVTSFGSGIFTNCGNIDIQVAPGHQYLWINDTDKIIYTADKKNLIYLPISLINVEINDFVTTIPESFFLSARNIETIKLPRDLDIINPYSFQLPKLKSIIIPKKCRLLGAASFSGTTAMKTLVFEDDNNMQDIFYSAFAGSGIQSINFGANCPLAQINWGCFSRCISLTQITFPPKLKVIDYNAFEHCTSLRTITIDGLIETIGVKCFIGTNIATINFNIARVSYGSFQQMSALRTVNFGSKVTVIEPQAFQSCPKLDTLVYDPQCIITEIGGYSFAYCIALTSVTIPASVTSLAPNSFSFSENLEIIEVNSGNTKYESIGGLVYSKGLDSMIICPAGKITVEINSLTTTIQEMGFYGCKKMTSIKMGDELVEIAKQSFWGCSSLQVVTIPSKIQKIGKEAFKECDLLSTIFYCADLGNIEHEDDPFPVQTKIYVPSTYMKSDFIGHPIIKSSSIRPDGCPNVPSNEFTRKKNRKLKVKMTSAVKKPIVIGALTMIVNNL